MLNAYGKIIIDIETDFALIAKSMSVCLTAPLLLSVPEASSIPGGAGSSSLTMFVVLFGEDSVTWFTEVNPPSLLTLDKAGYFCL